MSVWRAAARIVSLTIGLWASVGVLASSAQFAINEVAWGGADWDPRAEWIELVNVSNEALDLSGWRLVSSDGSPDIPLRGWLPPQNGNPNEGYYLLERSNDDTVPGVPADLIYVGALTDRGETLSLYDPEGVLVDTANSFGTEVPPTWPAGTGRHGLPAHGSMERIDYRLPDRPENWATCVTAFFLPNQTAEPIYGTPKRQNVAFNLPPSAAIAVTPLVRKPGETITFDATASTDVNDEIVSYEWDFGDGARGTGPIAHHTYETAGKYAVTLTVVDSKGSATVVGRTLTVAFPVPPLVDFSLLSTEYPFRAGDPVLFQDESSDDQSVFVAWRWNLGDGTIADGERVTHMYEQAGAYVIALSVTNDAGMTAQQTQSVTIASRRPEAGFSMEPETPTEGEAVLFDASTSSDPDGCVVAFQWDFDGDGSIDLETADVSTTHAFSRNGWVEPTLYVVDNNGDRSEQVRTEVYVNARPAAVFSASRFEAAELEEIAFVDLSYDPDGTITSWQWDFADGKSSVQTSPSHAFSCDGVYVVALTVVDDVGAEHAASAEITVSNLPPSAALKARSAVLETGQPFTFDAGAAHDPSPNGAIVRYEWDLYGAATFDRDTTAPVLSHAYDDDGTYVVRVRVTDDDGATALSDPVPISVTNRSPTVLRIDWGPADPVDGRSVSFSAEASDPDGVIVAWTWNLGDGTTTTAQTASHVFQRDDTFSVSLVVTDEQRATSEPFSVDVAVRNSPPVADFTAALSRCDAGGAIAFNARPSYDPSPAGHIAHLAWDFGDGSTCPGTPSACGREDHWMPVHCYSSAGMYVVTLVVIDEQGAMGRTSRQITVAD